MLVQHLEKLKYFQSVAEIGSISAAAQQLKIAQPALSHSIKTLESALGAQLFLRMPKGVTLTIAGETLLKYTVKLGELVNECEAKINHIDENQWQGKTRISSYEILIASVLPSILNQIEKIHPEWELQISKQETFQALFDQLMTHAVDVIITPYIIPHEKIAYRTAFEDRLVFVSRNEIKFESLAALAEFPMLYNPKMHLANDRTLEGILLAMGIVSPTIVQLDSLYSLISIACQTDSLLIIPQTCIQRELDSSVLKLVNCLEIKNWQKLLTYKIYLGYNPNVLPRMKRNFLLEHMPRPIMA